MKSISCSFRQAIVVGLFLTISQAACARGDSSAASAPAQLAQATTAAAAAVPAQTTAGLPDLTGLVERSAPAVVNITAVTMAGGTVRGGGQFPEDEEIPEFFRRFFGPPGGMPPGGRDQVSGGSGFVISPDGYILTNNHVVRGADEVTVRFADRREFTASVVGTDPATDIALLKVDSNGLPVVPLGDSNLLKPGQWVFAIGSPFGFDYSVTAGVVSATGRSVGGGNQQYVPFIQTDVAINRGNSGGPLFNLNGEVVGINSQIFSGTGGYMGISFAIPISTAQNVVEQLKRDGRVRRGLIGVQIQEVSREFAQSLGMERARGALVAQVVSGGAADQAGVRVGDVIIGFNGQEILSSSELPVLVGSVPPGTRAELEVFRDGRSRSLTVTVGEADADPEAVTPASTPEQPASANRLGMVLQELTEEQRSQQELGRREGVLVARVTGGAARRAGLQRGDVILRVGRTAVGSVQAFNDTIKDLKAGDSVMLLVRRGDGTSFLALNVREGD